MDRFYFEITDLWRKFCEEHNTLLDYTCEEYSNLLANNLTALEETLAKKQEVIANISILESYRQTLIKNINDAKCTLTPISSVASLLKEMGQTKVEREGKHLFRFNALLIDIIEKIQAQNKKNQMFISKAVNNLREIREAACGKKSYNLYNKTGKAVQKTVTTA